MNTVQYPSTRGVHMETLKVVGGFAIGAVGVSIFALMIDALTGAFGVFDKLFSNKPQ